MRVPIPALTLYTLHHFQWHVKLIHSLVLYNVVTLLVFLGIYLSIDFNRHFESTTPPASAIGKLYFAIMVQTGVGSNDIAPKTDLARLVVSLHAVVTWSQLALAFQK
jgi:hypothetical protein